MFGELIKEKNQAMLTGAISYFCLKLGITPEERELISFYEVSRIVPGTHGSCAGMYQHDKLIGIKIKIVSYASIVGMVDVLAHEMVHAKQHLRGEFSFEPVPTKVFFGLFTVNIIDKFHKGQSMTTTPYYDRLCEREAHTQSHILVTEFCKDIAIAQSKTDSINNEEELIVCPI
jgi:hypothetical protein